MDFFGSQWASALADLKDAAHDTGVATPEQTDAWDVRHVDLSWEEGMSHSFGYRLDDKPDGARRHIAWVSSPDALRNLRHTLKFIA